MDPAAIVCPACLDHLPCGCPRSAEHPDTLLVRLCLGAHAAAGEELRYLEGRTLDRTGERLAATERRIWQLALVKAWCTRQLWRRRIAAPRMTDHEAFGATDIDALVF